MFPTVATEVIQEAGAHLGAALSYVINLFNPHKIILSGALFASGDILLDSLKIEMRKHSLPLLIQNIKLEVGKLGNLATPVGAAAYIISEWLPSSIDPSATK